MYERSGNCIRSLLKAYQDTLPEDEGSILFADFSDMVNLLTMRGESKSGFHIKSHHIKNVFDRMLDRTGQWI